MRGLLRPLVVPLLRRDVDEVGLRARRFHIESDRGRDLVGRLGRAFLGGFNSMLEARRLEQVAEQGQSVPSHYRPFFFEGAAMGYLPRGYHASRCTRAHAERDLLGLRPEYRYLYYVGLGFWYGIRYARRPAALLALERHVDPLYFPLCYDGYGFKVGFFDHPGDPRALGLLEHCPARYRRYAYQGFGRSMFFVHMDDDVGLAALFERVGPAYRDDLELGRSLALGFTGLDRPETLLRHLEAARDEGERGARLTGVCWAMTARRMTDPDYFRLSLPDDRPGQTLLRTMPELCERVLAASTTYDAWQRDTRAALLALRS